MGIKTTRTLKVCSLNQLIKMFVDSRMLMFADLHGLAPFLFFAWQRLCIRDGSKLVVPYLGDDGDDEHLANSARF